MPHELVVEAQRVVQHAGVADDNRVLERAAEREALLAHPLHFLQETEGARGRDVVDERVFRQPDSARLVAQQRMVERDAVGHLEMVRRIDRNALVAARQRERLENLQVAPRGWQPLDAGLMNQVDERGRAAVHDRHFRGVQFDDDVVDAEADERRQQVLDGADVHRSGRKAGREIDGAEMADVCGNFEAAEIRTPETDTKVGGGGLEGQRHLLARMETNSRAGDWSTKCPLCVHQR